jgi:phage host-nuclease inhibitor protein Gam
MTTTDLIPTHRGAVRTDSDADDALHVLGRLDALRAATILEQGKQIEHIKAEHRDHLQAIDKERKAVKGKLKRWTLKRAPSWIEADGRRSLKLTHGRLGLRASVKIERLIPEEEAIERIERAGLERCLRRTVEVNLEALEEFDAETLAELGFERVEKADNFQCDAWESKGGRAVA